MQIVEGLVVWVVASHALVGLWVGYCRFNARRQLPNSAPEARQHPVPLS